MFTDPIADLLTRIRNASTAGHPTVSVAASKTKERILNVLLDEGYIDRVEQITGERNKSTFKIYIRYATDGSPVIREIRRLSRPGKRVYVPTEKIPEFKGGLGLVVVSTSRGMLSDREARRQRIGGELICTVF